jgi:ABC-2 type transport system ATP-binding protein
LHESPTSHAPLVAVEGLEVRYGERVALGGVSFEVGAGEVVALLGPNGAGKSTTFSVLATLRRPDGGTARVAGLRVDRDAAAVRRLLGVVPQALALYPSLSGRENMRFFAQMLGLRGVRARDAGERALAQAGLLDRADDAVTAYSGGMRRRLNLACGVLHDPRVLLLDEPTVGVDPQSRERIFETVRACADAGAGVLYSTHAMEEAERLCDRVVLLDEGRVVACGTPSELGRDLRPELVLELTTRTPLPDGWLAGLRGVRARSVEEHHGAAAGEAETLQVDDLAAADTALERAAERGGGVLRFALRQPGLEELFFARTGRALRD